MAKDKGPRPILILIPNENGYPDAGVYVTGVYVQDAGGCHYVIQYRADFGDDPSMDDGWIRQTITCEDGVYTYLIVSDEDPCYTGDEDRQIWNTWEWHVLTVSGYGNLANPMHPDYDSCPDPWVLTAPASPSIRSCRPRWHPA